MDNKDPQECCEEWFNVAIPITREFQLPNLSNPTSCHHQPLKNDQLEILVPNFPPQIPLIDTNLPLPLLDSEETCNIVNHQVLSISTTASTPACIPNTSVSYSRSSSSPGSLGLKALLGMRNQGSGRDMLPSGSIQGLRGSFSSPCFSQSRSIHMRCHQEGQFNPLPSRGSNLLVNQATPASAAAAWLDKLKLGERPEQLKTYTLHDVSSGGHRCSVCDMRFATGNALGGHMSSHAKRRKLEALRTGVLFSSSDNPSPHGDGHRQTKP